MGDTRAAAAARRVPDAGAGTERAGGLKEGVAGAGALVVACVVVAAAAGAFVAAGDRFDRGFSFWFGLCPAGCAVGCTGEATVTGAVDIGGALTGVRSIHTNTIAMAPIARAISSSVPGATAMVSRSACFGGCCDGGAGRRMPVGATPASISARAMRAAGVSFAGADKTGSGGAPTASGETAGAAP